MNPAPPVTKYFIESRSQYPSSSFGSPVLQNLGKALLQAIACSPTQRLHFCGIPHLDWLLNRPNKRWILSFEDRSCCELPISIQHLGNAIAMAGANVVILARFTFGG